MSKASTLKHTQTGNCWKVAYVCKVCGKGELCDVCHDHDEPRGECSECLVCVPCDEQAEEKS